jgi:hypothetical protein
MLEPSEDRQAPSSGKLVLLLALLLSPLGAPSFACLALATCTLVSEAAATCWMPRPLIEYAATCLIGAFLVGGTILGCAWLVASLVIGGAFVWQLAAVAWDRTMGRL